MHAKESACFWVEFASAIDASKISASLEHLILQLDLIGLSLVTASGRPIVL